VTSDMPHWFGCCNREDAELTAVLEGLGINEGWQALPAHLRANQLVDLEKSKVPVEVVNALPAHLRAGVGRATVKRVSYGWHEGYKVTLPPAAKQTAAAEPAARSFFLRIWRNELGYFRIDTPISRGLELQAISLAREAGLCTASVVGSTTTGADDVGDTDGEDGGRLALGTCLRDGGCEAEFCCFDWVEHRSRPRRKDELSRSKRTTLLLKSVTLSPTPPSVQPQNSLDCQNAEAAP
jgi:hypothetical protein